MAIVTRSGKGALLTHGELDGNFTHLDGKIDLEESARISADNTLTTNLSNEVTRATNAETTLQSNIDSEESARIAGDTTLTTNLSNEVTRATTAETTLQSNIDSEESARTTADITLTDSINIEKARIDSILSASSADKDSFKEIVDLINSIDTANDTTFAGYVVSNDARSTQIESDLTSSNTTLQTNIDSKVDNSRVLTDVPAGAVFTDTDTVYVHPTTAGNKHIPSGGTTNQVLTYSSNGTAVWADANAGSSKTLLSSYIVEMYGDNFNTINEILDYYYSNFEQGNTDYVITILIPAGTTISEQIMVKGIDLSWINIVTMGGPVIIDNTSLTENYLVNGLWSAYPFLAAIGGGKLPNISGEFTYSYTEQSLESARVSVLVDGPGSSVKSNATFNYSPGITYLSSNQAYANIEGTINNSGGEALRVYNANAALNNLTINDGYSASITIDKVSKVTATNLNCVGNTTIDDGLTPEISIESGSIFECYDMDITNSKSSEIMDISMATVVISNLTIDGGNGKSVTMKGGTLEIPYANFDNAAGYPSKINMQSGAIVKAPYSSGITSNVTENTVTANGILMK